MCYVTKFVHAVRFNMVKKLYINSSVNVHVPVTGSCDVYTEGGNTRLQRQMRVSLYITDNVALDF